MSDSSEFHEPDASMFQALLKCPIKRNMVLELLAANKDAIKEYQDKEKLNTSVKKLKSKPESRCESPSALLRRRALLQMNTNSPRSKTTSSRETQSECTEQNVPFNEIFKDVVAYLEIRGQHGEDRSDGAKSILRSMGAVVKDDFTSDVTHVIFKDGMFTTYKQAKQKRVHLVSILWVEFSRKAGQKLPENLYPALRGKLDDESMICSQMQKEYEDIIKEEYKKNFPQGTLPTLQKYVHRRRTLMTPSMSSQSYETANGLSGSDMELTKIVSKGFTINERACKENVIFNRRKTISNSLSKINSKRNLSASQNNVQDRVSSSVSSVNSTMSELQLSVAKSESMSRLELSPTRANIEISQPKLNVRKKKSKNLSSSIRNSNSSRSSVAIIDVSSSQKSTMSASIAKPSKSSQNISEIMTSDSSTTVEISSMGSNNDGRSVDEDVVSISCNSEEYTTPKSDFKDFSDDSEIISQFDLVDRIITDLHNASLSSDSSKKRKSPDVRENDSKKSRKCYNPNQSIDLINGLNQSDDNEREEHRSKIRNKPKLLKKLNSDEKFQKSKTLRKLYNPDKSYGEILIKSDEEQRQQLRKKTTKPPEETPCTPRRRSVRIQQLTPIVNRRSTMEFMPTPSPKKLMPPPSMKKVAKTKKLPTIVCTKLHRDEVQVFRTTVKKLGRFICEDQVSERTTHLVAGEPKRTINMLRAAARGLWVVKFDWIRQSLKAGKWLAEDNFEVTEFSPAIQKAHLERQAFGPEFTMDIFKNCPPIYVAPSTSPPCSELRELIELCQGKIVRSPGFAKIIIGRYLNETSIVCVTEAWILDSITFYKRLPTKGNYLLTEIN